MDQKRKWENEFLAKVKADPALRKQYASAWSDIAQIRARFRQIDVRRRYYAANAYGSKLLNLALGTVRYPVESAKPDSARLPAIRMRTRRRLRRTCFSTTPIDPKPKTALLTAYFTAMQKELPATDPVLKQALAGRTRTRPPRKW
jgi:hypothetical protein